MKRIVIALLLLLTACGQKQMPADERARLDKIRQDSIQESRIMDSMAKAEQLAAAKGSTVDRINFDMLASKSLPQLQQELGKGAPGEPMVAKPNNDIGKLQPCFKHVWKDKGLEVVFFTGRACWFTLDKNIKANHRFELAKENNMYHVREGIADFLYVKYTYRYDEIYH